MSFLSQTFQAGSSNNTGSVISVLNSTTLPLPDPTGSASFTGAWVSAEKYSVIQCALVSNTPCNLFILQSFEPIDNEGILPFVYSYEEAQLDSLQNVYHYVTLPWVKIEIYNFDSGNELFYLSTKLSLTPPPPSSSIQPISGTVSVDNFPAIQDISGSVVVSNLITETLATRSVFYLVVGNWYRVATVGITSGAEWNAIGAIVGGESIPTIGRLFKCLQIGPNLGGAGTCYDVEYNNDTTVSGTVKIQDSNGGTIDTTAGNLMVGIGNIYTANPLHTIVDSGTVEVSSITGALPTGTNAIGSVSVSNFPASGIVEVSNLITETLATRSVFYLVVGNWYRVATVGITSGAEWNAIGAIVGGESIPTIGRLFKCLQIGPNLGGAGTCYDVEYNNDTTVSGTVEVSSITGALPTGTNAIGSVVASNLPLITQAGTEGVFCKVSATYLGDSTTQDSSIVCYATQGPDNLVRLQIADPSDIPSGDLRELRTTDNSGNILLASIDGKITACNTGAVVISSGTVTTTENPSLVISLSGLSATTQQIKASAGSLQSISITYDHTSTIAYVKIYDALTANGTDTPKLTLPVVYNTTVQFETHNIQFSTGICIRAVDTYTNGITNPAGTVYATCFYV